MGWDWGSREGQEWKSGGGRSQTDTCIILFSLFKPWEARGCKTLNFSG